MQQEQHRNRAPRRYYGPRTLVSTGTGRYGKSRIYGKRQDAPRGKTTLPEAWSTVCPNRITERRIAAGMENVIDLHRAIGVISYQRLVKMEIGRVLIRDSEYELVADALKLHEDDLKLPLLTHSETIRWTDKWGARRQIEEGGDEDSVILAAYVRFLVEESGISRTSICRQFGAPENCLSAMWYAEKPIDRWPDTAMSVVIKLSRAKDWDEVILSSRAMHADRALDDHIADVVKPRIRYAPEDPDRKAPWTYETNPFRTRKAKRQVQTPLSAAPADGSYRQRVERRKQQERQTKQHARAERERIVRTAYADAVYEAKHGNQEGLLEALFPNASSKEIRAVTSNSAFAALIISRVALTRAPTNTRERHIAAEMLGITEERVRQIGATDNGTLASFLPKINAGFNGLMNS